MGLVQYIEVAWYKHTKDYDNDLEEEMQRRFQNTICNAKNGKGVVLCQRYLQ